MTRKAQYPTRKGEEYDGVEERPDALLDQIKNFAHNELKHIGLDKVRKLEKELGRDHIKVKKAKLDCFFNAYAILGTVRFAAQVCGLNPRVVSKVIRSSKEYQERFELAHEEFAQYLEQTAIIRALNKSDSLLQFLMRAYNPKKYSERLRLQALTQQEEDTSPVQLMFGEVLEDFVEPNFAVHGASVDTILEEEREDDVDE